MRCRGYRWRWSAWSAFVKAWSRRVTRRPTTVAFRPHEQDRHHRHRVRRPHDRRLLRPPRPRGRVRRHRRRQGRAPRPRRDCPIVEAGLESLVAEGLRRGRLRFVARRRQRRHQDCEFVYLACRRRRATTAPPTCPTSRRPRREIAPLLPPEAIVVNKSTVPVGSTKVVERVLGRRDVYVVSNPEFLREGSAVHDFLQPRPHRRSAATTRRAAIRVAVAVPRRRRAAHRHRPGLGRDDQVRRQRLPRHEALASSTPSPRSARRVGADVNDVVLGMGYDKRIGHDSCKPGPGWGGSCFPKDTQRAGADRRRRRATTSTCSRASSPSTTSSSTGSPTRSCRAAGGALDGRRVAVWGLTFKARTDDLRDSPSLAIIARLQAAGAKVQAYDPTVERARRRASSVATRSVRGAATAPTCSPCSPSGTSSAGSTSSKVAAADGRPRRRRRPQPARPRRLAARRLRLPGHRPVVTCARVVVTGGAGFIGSHLCRALLDRGDEVVAIDNFVTGRPRNIAHLPPRAVHPLEHDVTDPSRTRRRPSTRC